MADKKLIIADGHHRYETALNYRNQMRNRPAEGDPEAPYERVIITFVNMDAPGLVILPTHRVVFGLENFNIFDMVVQMREVLRSGRPRPLTDVPEAVRTAARGGQRWHRSAGGYSA